MFFDHFVNERRKGKRRRDRHFKVVVLLSSAQSAHNIFVELIRLFSHAHP